MKEMHLYLRTRTALWAGEDRIRETMLLGSMRWWYETLVRGLGGRACDPTGEGRDELTDEATRLYHTLQRQGYARDEALDRAGLCPVCRVFGARGWRRRFILRVVEEDTTPGPAQTLRIVPVGRARGWELPPGRMGRFTLQLLAEDGRVLALLAGLFLFLEAWGHLGGKGHLGYGVFRIENREEVLAWARGEHPASPGWRWRAMGSHPPHDALPDLRRFRFFHVVLRPTRPGWWTMISGVDRVGSHVQPLVSQGTVPLTPSLRNTWRFRLFRERYPGARNRQVETAVFGSWHPRKLRGRVMATWAYRDDEGRWHVRGWMWGDPAWADDIWSILTDPKGWAWTLQREEDPGALQDWWTMEEHAFRDAGDVAAWLNTLQDGTDRGGMCPGT